MSDEKTNKYRFPIPLSVRFADTDLQGHVFFGNYLTYCDEGFMAYLEHIGYSWQKLENIGLELYYVECSCQFKGRAYFGDILQLNTRIAHLGKSSMTAEILISKSRSDDIVAIGRIKGVMVSKQTGRSTPIPTEVREAIIKHESP